MIDNISARPISGAFANLPDGGSITGNGFTYTAAYPGGDGNNLVLTPNPVPEPFALALLGAGILSLLAWRKRAR